MELKTNIKKKVKHMEKQHFIKKFPDVKVQQFETCKILSKRDIMKIVEEAMSFRFHEDFHRFFPDISMEDIRDSLLTVINGHITIDITQFGRQIEKLYPEEWNRMSITEIVIKHYGKEADDFLNVII